ncbi:hypothetical protein KC363_g3885 [Hortaea werneckii]|nr:hypothetical protein KC325_g2557 [Hortaea werneckii]KAI6996732.1 hypothetical protein KC359_g3289 [Hortaea werneckii]KAI7148025.1 hypothetical protein KC344_g2276 [Hortaea werneckii]KAI7177504.1 hypothetical protein KC360_g2239 [Hortaea werneckii]KAI7191333.1 hypothetical protein KC363_g3885 [Hortaea werneckii]
MEDAGVLSGRDSLVDRIKKAISRYKNLNKRPPFKPDELFTMVIAVKRQPVTKVQVLKWVLANFKYYQNMVDQEFVNFDPSIEVPSLSRPKTKSNRFRTSIHNVPLNYELYLNTCSAQDGPDRYTMTVASCERGLSRVLPPQHGLAEKAFRLFDLPPELRNMIFNFVFQYPQSGLLFSDYFSMNGRGPAIIDAPADHDMPTWRESCTLPRTAKITDILAPLLVNKQFYEETKSCFLAINHFNFEDNEIMGRRLAKIPKSQRQHIQHVTLHYKIGFSPKMRGAKEAIALLATCGLKKLNLYLEEDKWKETGTTSGGKVFKKNMDLMNMPGLRKLRMMRGLEEVNFYGCPTVEALIKADMLKPKPKPKKKQTGGTKRKAEDEIEGGKKSIRR